MSHLGIVAVADGISEARVRRCLPPEHQIVGWIMRESGTEYLVSGPLMPEGKPSAAEYVRISFTIHARPQLRRASDR